jgi:hypothetical protein
VKNGSISRTKVKERSVVVPLVRILECITHAVIFVLIVMPTILEKQFKIISGSITQTWNFLLIALSNNNYHHFWQYNNKVSNMRVIRVRVKLNEFPMLKLRLISL